MRLRRLGPDSLYVLTGLPLALVSFVVLVAGLALGIGLLITLLGIPVAALTLNVARWFAAVERARLPRVLGHAVSAPPYPQHEGQGLARRFGQLRDPQSWRDVVHGIAVLPVAVITWSFAVTWWAAALGSITYPLWSWAVPGDGARHAWTHGARVGVRVLSCAGCCDCGDTAGGHPWLRGRAGRPRS
jgi:hypothetical protein